MLIRGTKNKINLIKDLLCDIDSFDYFEKGDKLMYWLLGWFTGMIVAYIIASISQIESSTAGVFMGFLFSLLGLLIGSAIDQSK